MDDEVTAGGEAYEDVYEAWDSAETDAERLGRRFQLEMASNQHWSLEDISTEEYQEIGATAAGYGLTEDDVQHISSRLFRDYHQDVEDMQDRQGPAYGHLIDHVVAEGLDHVTTSDTGVYGDTDQLETDREPASIEAGWPTELSRYFGEQGDLDGVVRTWFSIPHLEEDTEFLEAQNVTPSVTRTDVEQAIEAYHEEGGVPSPGLGTSDPTPPDQLE